MNTDWTAVTPLVDDPEQEPQYWEPHAFKVGDRVRVRLSGECNRHWPDETPRAADIVGHPDEWNGRTGTVVPAQCPDLLTHHPIGVWLDGEPVDVNGVSYTSGRFTVIELEPLSP